MGKMLFITLNWFIIIGFITMSLYLSYQVITTYKSAFKDGLKSILNKE